MEKVHVDQRAQETGLIVRGFIEHFEDEAPCAHHEAGEERGDRAGSIEPRPQNPEDEADRDRRADVTLHALQIDP